MNGRGATICCDDLPQICARECPPRSSPAGTILAGPLSLAGINAQTSFAVIHNFAGSPLDGISPFAGLIQGPDGTLYGTTSGGGSVGLGTVFQFLPDGSGFTILHHFMGGMTDGANPTGGLIQGPDGTLYGTTSRGGSGNLGTVFQLAPDGTGFAILHHFTGGAADGDTPKAGLIQGPDGTLYGTTTNGGTDDLGTVFQLAPDGSGFTVLHHFTGGTEDGDTPNGGLIQGPDGTLYGTTIGGGGDNNYGTAFRLAPDGSGFSVLHAFTGAPAGGAYPVAGLMQGPDGTLYGTTRRGGAANLGTVFQLAPDGSLFTILRSFMGNPMMDGAYPAAGIIQGPDGTLYGTTVNGGVSRVVGTVFQLAPDGSGYSVSHIFDVDPSDGALPFGGLILGADGTLYGTTSQGGMNGGGVVFQVSPAS